MNEIESNTTDIAAAPVRSSFSIRVRIHCEDTSVLPGTAADQNHRTELADSARKRQARTG